ncbi:hypothetical protein ABZP36_032442 [Zizania latifolia]
MGRAPCCDKASVKKGPWSPEEDAKLKAYIEENGTGGNWIALPQKIGLNRCGKSCRLRWLNYLRPNIKHGDFTEEEEHIICSLYISIGSRWSIIAAQLPGRTDNDIKNYWNTKLKKKLLGKRGPSRRAGRANQEPACGTTLAATEGGAMCGRINGGGATAAAQALSSSALERIQLHMRLQGLYSAFSCASINSNAPPKWPKLETTLLPNRPLPAVQPTDAVATAVSVQHHPQHLVIGQTLAAAAATSEAFEAEQLDPAAGANYMPGGLDQRAKLGFCSSSAEAGVAGTVESSPSSLLGWFGYGPHDELYDFLYSRCDQSVGGAQGGIVPHLPELQCPDGGAIVGADEKFSAWTASCDYGPAGQLQGNPVNMQDYVLGYDQ